MNFVAHLVVAMQVTDAQPHDDQSLGAVLPDLAPMAGLRFDRDLLPPAVMDGVSVHHATDAAFHSLPWFVDVSTTDRQVLEDAGLPRGAARACAHVGAEMLLDGVLLQDPAVRDALADLVAGLDPARLGETDPVRIAQWDRLFSRMRHAEMHRAYESPDAVADRLAGALSHRPRLALAEEHRPALVASLTNRHTDVSARAAHIVAATSRSCVTDLA